MGRFREIKYYPDDLEKEISFPLTKHQKACWINNVSVYSHKLQAYEVDDFYSTLRLGELPYNTCISYLGGTHSDCLLSGYDSNKKILLAKKNGNIVARAVIRLTKGSASSIEDSQSTLEFADLLADDGVHNKPNEQLTLFLERMYIANCSSQESVDISSMFVKIAKGKADEMGAVSVLATGYMDSFGYGYAQKCGYVKSNYYIYISKSKGGAQYLDSLSGPASVSKEGSYNRGAFFVSIP